MDLVKFVLCLNWQQDTRGKNLLAHIWSSTSPQKYNLLSTQTLNEKNDDSSHYRSLPHIYTCTLFQIVL